LHAACGNKQLRGTAAWSQLLLLLLLLLLWCRLLLAPRCWQAPLRLQLGQRLKCLQQLCLTIVVAGGARRGWRAGLGIQAAVSSLLLLLWWWRAT
jgi:hypothetical protein